MWRRDQGLIKKSERRKTVIIIKLLVYDSLFRDPMVLEFQEKITLAENLFITICACLCFLVYVARVKELGMNSAAITDHGVMFGVIDFYREAKKAGINPILGCAIIPSWYSSRISISTRGL